MEESLPVLQYAMNINRLNPFYPVWYCTSVLNPAKITNVNNLPLAQADFLSLRLFVLQTNLTLKKI